jgi:hypothetical protein
MARTGIGNRGAYLLEGSHDRFLYIPIARDSSLSLQTRPIPLTAALSSSYQL